jgi:CheY-like chemotaxis protein
MLQPRVLDLNALLANLGKMLPRLIGEDIELQTVLAPDLRPTRADPGQIEQVILNLVVNARDAMPTGGRLTVETANVELDEEYARDHEDVQPGSYVMLAVTDTGCGMDRATLARVFEPFFTTKPVGQGTGLGLATVYGIVKQTNGSVFAYSEVGIGTTFKVYLPCTSDSRPGVETTPLPAALGGRETVLLVEDEESVRALTRRVLQAKGYAVLEAANGPDALALVARHAGPLHLLVTDVVMPRMSGRELATRLEEVRPGVKVLYVSGYTDDAVVRHGVLEAGAMFLQKPFSPDALARKVRDVLTPAGK